MKLNKKQKRTATIASMAALLAVVLGMGGQTFAKYITTTAAPTQTATVAKWGLVANIQANGIFGSDYYDGPLATTATGTNLVVNGTGDAKVVAPGTTGSMTFSVTGSAEVKAKMAVSMEGTKTVVLKDSSDAVVYEPIKWTLTKTDVGTTTIAENKTLKEITTEISKVSETIEAGKNMGTAYYTLSWAWAFEGQNDTYDTYLGDISNEETVSGFTAVTEMEFHFSMTLTQTQE